MSAKYILAALSMAISAAASVLAEHAAYFDDDGNYIGPVDGDDTPAPTPPQVTPSEVATAQLDVDGLPWDARIHASTKTQTQKKQWTRRKGVDDTTYNAVIAELRALYPAATVATAPAVPTTPTVSVPTAPAITVPTPAAPQTPYQQLVDWLARNTGDNKQLTPAWVNEQLAANGTSLAALAANQELSAAWLEQFRAIGKQLGLPE